VRSSISRTGLWLSLLAAACASSPDHFYTLNTLPDGERGPLSTPTVHVRLNVTIPALVDRAEMVISTSRNGVVVLDHERWAVPLSDHVSQTLARDIERRRPDILIGDRGFDQAASPPVTMKVDIVRMSAQRGGQARIEARWRIVDGSAATDELGSAAFEAPLGGDDTATVAQAYSQALSALAERLAGDVRRR
jgi:uncharacterized lipoprotein YmbA